MIEPIDIIINNFTRLQYLEIIVREIKKRTEYPYRIIVVDNASTPRTKLFVKQLLKDGLIHEAVFDERNLTLPQSFKKGFEYVKSEYFVMTVDDTIPPWTKPCWLTHLHHLIKNNEKYGAIALKYRYDTTKSYFDNYRDTPVPVELNNDNVEHKYAVEEFFQIQSKADMAKVGFSRKNVAVYEFSRSMERILNKKIGKTTKESGLICIALDDDNCGYLPEVINRKKFFDKKKFRNVKTVACFMAHHDDQFIDRFLENLSQFTDEFYINLNEASPYTEKVCREHKNTKAIIETKNDGNWHQGHQRELTVRMLDDVKPDIVLFPDTDELYGDDLKFTLEKFWDAHKKGLWFELKYCWGAENTVRLDRHFKKMVHIRAFKWQPNLTYDPYKGFACPNQLFFEKHRKFYSDTPVKHLKFLKQTNLDRVKNETKAEKPFVKTYEKFDENFGA